MTPFKVFVFKAPRCTFFENQEGVYFDKNAMFVLEGVSYLNIIFYVFVIQRDLIFVFR